MTHYHAVVWIDHSEAKVLSFNADDVDESIVRPANPHVHVHHKAGVTGPGKDTPDVHFMRKVADSLHPFGEILIAGPGTAKTELAEFIRQHDAGLSAKILGVQTLDHPSDGQIVAFGRKYFRAADRMRR
ncbi:MAG: translational machinery protein [Gemmatimonas sp.]